MPNWIELRLAVQGLLRLARFNSDFQRFFDQSPRGALRSFWLAMPIYPYILVLLWRSEAMAHVADPAQFVFAMSVAYLHLWLLPPVIMTWILPLIGRRAELSGCICMYNWLSLLNVGIALPLLLLEIAGVPPDIMSIPNGILDLVSLVWEAFLLTHVLRLALWQAGLASIVDYVVMHHIVVPIFLLMGGVS
jgi:hypothetical protein